MRTMPLAELSHLTLTIGSSDQVECLKDFVLSRQTPIPCLECFIPGPLDRLAVEDSSRVTSELNSLFTFAEVQSHVLFFSCIQGLPRGSWDLYD